MSPEEMFDAPYVSKVLKTPAPTRGNILREAQALIEGARSETYGPPEDNFQRVADLWNAYFHAAYGQPPFIKAGDVALLMALFKVARLANDSQHRDSWVDLCGYAACGAEIALSVSDA